MSENENAKGADDERVDIYATVLDERLRLHLPSDGWTFEEAKIAKNVSEGMTPSQIEASLLQGDPDAWMAVLRISYIRAGKDFPHRRLQGEDVIALFNRLLEVAEEALRNRPPTSRNESESSESSEKPEDDETGSPSSV